MYNFKHGNVLRIFLALILLGIFIFLFLQNIPGVGSILLLVALVLITAFSTYHYNIMEGLVISIGLAYTIIVVSVYAYWTSSVHLGYLKPLVIIFAAYLATNLYKYILSFIGDMNLKNKAASEASTGLFTQRYLELKLEAEFDKAHKRNTVLSLMFIEVDGGANEAAFLIKKYSRSYDFIARYDRECFCIVLPRVKEKQAMLYAKKLRKAAEKVSKIKLNIGIVNFPDTQIKSWQELLECAKLAMHKAKEDNAIHVYRNH